MTPHTKWLEKHLCSVYACLCERWAAQAEESYVKTYRGESSRRVCSDKMLFLHSRNTIWGKPSDYILIVKPRHSYIKQYFLARYLKNKINAVFTFLLNKNVTTTFNLCINSKSFILLEHRNSKLQMLSYFSQ